MIRLLQIHRESIELMSEKTQNEPGMEDHDDHGPTSFEEEGLSMASLGLIMLITVVFVVIAVIAAYTLATTTTQEYKMEAVAAAVYPELRDVRAASAAKMNKYEVLDSEVGVFQIPIEKAKEILLNEAYLEEETQEFSTELLIKKP